MLDSNMDTLLAAAECRNFTRAAKQLSLTQPAVSHQIQRLEEELGAPLFLRGSGGLKLTPQGEIAVKYAKRFKALYGKMRTEIENSERGTTRLRVGITHTS